MRLGNTAAAPFLGTEFVSLYQGAVRVPTVPGRPVIVSATYETNIFFTLSNDGGESIDEYKVYVDGVLDLGTSLAAEGELAWLGGIGGETLRISAVNAIGEGPLSDPFVLPAA